MCKDNGGVLLFLRHVSGGSRLIRRTAASSVTMCCVCGEGDGVESLHRD